jgi:hypothetical protein
MPASQRQYDIVLFGATGYTGNLTAEHIATHLPTDLKWAIAGRSSSKLETVAAECKALNADRVQPGELPFHITTRDYCHVMVISPTSIMSQPHAHYARYVLSPEVQK